MITSKQCTMALTSPETTNLRGPRNKSAPAATLAVSFAAGSSDTGCAISGAGRGALLLFVEAAGLAIGLGFGWLGFAGGGSGASGGNDPPTLGAAPPIPGVPGSE